MRIKEFLKEKLIILLKKTKVKKNNIINEDKATFDQQHWTPKSNSTKSKIGFLKLTVKPIIFITSTNVNSEQKIKLKTL